MTNHRPVAPTAPAMPSAVEPAASVELGELVKLAFSLTPCWNSPLKFHERKSELMTRLRKATRRVEHLEFQLAAQREAAR
jgi:hypothetical protein